MILTGGSDGVVRVSKEFEYIRACFIAQTCLCNKL